MEWTYANQRYSTEVVRDQNAGYAAVELYRTAATMRERIARVVFWDAQGQLFIETFGTEVPLIVAQKLIDEAKGIIMTG